MQREVMNELRTLVSRVSQTNLTDTQEEVLFARINDLSPDPEWSNYIFHSDEFVDSNGVLDLDRLIARLAAYQSITL